MNTAIRSAPTLCIRYARLSSVFLISLVGVLLYRPLTTHADGKNVSSPTIAYHEQRNGGIPFAPSNQRKLVDQLFGRLSKEQKLAAGKMVLGFVGSLPKTLSHMGTLQALPECKEAVDKRVQVFTYSPNSEAIDYVLYSPTSAVQKRRAEKVSFRSVPYRSGESFGITNSGINERAVFGMMMAIRCLPTRVHFVIDGANRFFEYREGENAWLEDGSPAKSRVEYYGPPNSIEPRETSPSKISRQPSRLMDKTPAQNSGGDRF